MRWLTLIVLASFLLVGWVFFDWGPYLRDPSLLRAALEEHPFYAPLIFIALQIIAETMLLPGSPFTVVGGLIFGTFWGTAFSLFGSVMAAVIIFSIMRYVGSSSVIQYLHSRFSIVRRYNLVLMERGLRHVLFLRLLPFAPNNALSVSFGLTRVSLADFIMGTALGNLPSTLLFAYFGNFVTVVDNIIYMLTGIALVILISFLWFRYYGGERLISSEK